MSRIRPFLIVGAVAIVVRLVLHAGGFPGALTGVPVGDERMYADWAARIAEGAWSAGDGTAPAGEAGALYHAPGYAWLLGALHTLFGSSPNPATAPEALTTFIHASLGVVTSLFVFAATRRAFGSATGVAAGILYAVFPAALFYESFYGKTPLAQCCVAFALWSLVVVRDRVREGQSFVLSACTFGLAVGLGALVQELVLALLPLALFVSTPGLASSFRTRFAVLGCALAGFIVALTPQFARNAALDQPLLQGTVNSGQNLWIGSGAGADGFYRPIYAGRGATGIERDDARQAAWLATGTRLGPNEVSDWWRDRALSDIRSSPLTFAALYAKKLGAVFAAEEWMDTRAFAAHRDRSTLLDVLAVPLHFGMLAALAFAALLVRLQREERGAARLAPFVLGTLFLALGLALFLIYGRLRLSLSVFLIPLAADGLLRLADVVRGRSMPGLWVLAVPAILALSLIPDEDEVHPVATTWSNVAAAHTESGREESAWILASEAVSTSPDSADAQLLFGELSLARGDLESGRAAIRAAVGLEPAYGFRALVALAEVEFAHGDAEASRSALSAAMESPSFVAEDMGRAALLWRQFGELKRAADLYERALSIDPQNATTHGNYGYLQALRGQARSAVQHYEQALSLDPTNTRTTLNLAWIRAAGADAALRDASAAMSLVDRAATQLSEDDAEILDARAAIAATSGAFETAARLAERAAQSARSAGRPEYAQAIDARRALYEAGEPFRQTPQGTR